MRCPRCSEQTLQEHAIESWQVQVCLQCGGLWLSAASFRDAAKRPPPAGTGFPGGTTAAPPVWEESPLRCPACHASMRKGRYAYSSGVVIDRCAPCNGIWLDRGELAKIRAYVHQDVPPETRLMAELEADSMRRRLEAQERREGARYGLAGASFRGDRSLLKGLLSFIWGLVSGTIK